MLRVVNKTPFAAALAPALDKDGIDHAIVVVKGTFPLGPDPGRNEVEVEELPVTWQDLHHGEPDRTSIKYSGDAALRKPGTDVYLVANAHATRGAVKMLEAAIEVGSGMKKTVRVIGDRAWHRSLGSWKASDPAAFETMPIIYEKAFGGHARNADGSPSDQFDDRNPVGTGFAGKDLGSGLEGMPLPNVEDPRQLITSPKDRPPPSGFGAIGRGWQPRAKLAGTMDEAWQAARCPLLPVDFDDRFHQASPPDLVSPTHLKGGEPVRLTNLSRQASLVFSLPRRSIEVTARIKGSDSKHPTVLDTVLMEPERRRMVLTWRATIPCPREFLLIDFVRIEQAA